MRTSYGGGYGLAGNQNAGNSDAANTPISSSGGHGSTGSYSVATSGGGAGLPALPYRFNSSLFTNLRSQAVVQGVAGFNDSMYIAGNPGINGYGAGGGGGNNNTTRLYGGNGAGNGGWNSGAPGGSGAANRGGGGGGSWAANVGGSGGSGVCIIKYWSAL